MIGSSSTSQVSVVYTHVNVSPEFHVYKRAACTYLGLATENDIKPEPISRTRAAIGCGTIDILAPCPT